MENCETIRLEFYTESHSAHFEVPENFNTHTDVFRKMAQFIGDDHHFVKNLPDTHLTTLEKLEILCKVAREHIFEQSEYEEDYKEVKVFSKNEKVTFGEASFNTTLYDEIRFFSNQFFKVRNGLKYGLLDSNSQEILPLEQDDIFKISKNYICCRREGLSYIYTLEGVEVMGNLDGVTETTCGPLEPGPDYFWVKKEGKWGLIDQHLNFIIPCRLDYDTCNLVSNFGSNFYVKVEKDGKAGMINGLLNIDIISLDEDIEDIMYVRGQKYLITKKGDLPDFSLHILEAHKIEKQIRDQN